MAPAVRLRLWMRRSAARPAVASWTAPRPPGHALPTYRPASLLPARSTELPPYAHKAGAGKEAEQHDAALASVLARLAEHRRRRTLLLAFAQSPVDFIHAMVAAQVPQGTLA